MEKSGLFDLLATYCVSAGVQKTDNGDMVYGPYEIHHGRKIVIVISPDGKRRTVSYPKYIMESHLGIQLDPDKHTIDHIDGDINNNDLSNFEILPRNEHSTRDTRRVNLIDLDCVECGKKFKRSPRLLRDKAKKGNSGPFCSRTCSGRNNRKRQLGLIEAPPVQPHHESTYYKQKHLSALSFYLMKKYGLKS